MLRTMDKHSTTTQPNNAKPTASERPGATAHTPASAPRGGKQQQAKTTTSAKIHTNSAPNIQARRLTSPKRNETESNQPAPNPPAEPRAPNKPALSTNKPGALSEAPSEPALRAPWRIGSKAKKQKRRRPDNQPTTPRLSQRAPYKPTLRARLIQTCVPSAQAHRHTSQDAPRGVRARRPALNTTTEPKKALTNWHSERGS